MSNILGGKTIIVTGSGGGVGQHIAEEAARQGANVIVNDIGKDSDGYSMAQQVTEKINSTGGEAIASQDDISDWSAAEKLIESAMDNFGHLDGIVNNAGILRDRIFHKMSEEEWDQSINVNLKGCFNTARIAAPIFKEQETGVFVHMTSTSGLVGNLGQANYCAGKMGVAGLSRAIAIDMQRFNVRSNCIAPFAMTPMLMAGVPRETEEQKARWKILEKQSPEKIAPLVCALLSDSAIDITGQIFGARANEVFLFSQPRPIRTGHIGHDGGITTEAVIDRILPAFKPSMYSLERTTDVFSWEPI